MTARHTALALASATLIAACAAGAGDADTSDDGGDDVTGASSSSGSGSGAATSGSGAATSGSSTTTGAGGANASGSTGSGNTSSSTSGSTTSGSTTASSTSSGGGSCQHDVCTEGAALTYGCGDPCVNTVCDSDAFCCDAQDGAWDNLCVDAAAQLCGAMCNGGGGGTVAPGDLVISEIMNNPAAVADSAGEWFEIYNDAPYPIDLMGLGINHIAGDPTAVHTIALSVVVPSGGYVALGINANSGTNGGVNVAYQYSAVNLNNTADYLALVDGTTVIDEVSWDESSGLDPSGASRNLDPIYLSASQNDTDLNFCVATSMMSGGDAGTPGAANDGCP